MYVRFASDVNNIELLKKQKNSFRLTFEAKIMIKSNCSQDQDRNFFTTKTFASNGLTSQLNKVHI